MASGRRRGDLRRRRLGAQCRGLRRVGVRVGVRVVQRDGEGEVERSEQLRQPAADAVDAGGADDPAPAAHGAEGRGLGGLAVRPRPALSGTLRYAKWPSRVPQDRNTAGGCGALMCTTVHERRV
ncbi:hypothetical protein GCM10027075_04140 [Streptomyces heilongjiangensis]